MTKLIFLTPKETAELLRLSVPTLARWRTDGTGPEYQKFGQRVLYRREAIEAFIERTARKRTRPDG